ncbi:MAG: DNA polymerase III subunit alpha [Phycisphaerales bacterium]
MRYPTEIYVKSPQEMAEVFEPYGDAGAEALANVDAIAARCNVTLPIGANNAPMVRVRRKGTESAKKKSKDEWAKLPEPGEKQFGGDLTAWYEAYCREFEVVPFSVPDDASEDEKKSLLTEAKTECDVALRYLAEGGYIWRYGTNRDAPDEAEKRARLERELKILSDKGISAYFLIVWDFVNWGRQNGVPGLARGSGVGTMVGYVMGLSNACPVRYGLLFERFTDPDRSEYPDIDIDLCQDGRGRVISYVREKYGHVAQIITFGTLKARAAIRDVGRVLEMPLSEVDKVAKLVPEQLGMTLDKALEQEPDLKKLYEADPTVKRCIDNARAIEGQARHSSVHAAGVIVATRPLNQIVPLYKPSNSEDIVTQWDGPTCEKMGLLKMDFLGLRTISVVARAKRLIREGLGEDEMYRALGRTKGDGGPNPLDLDRLDFKDQKVFEMFRRGDTTGVFQFESPGMRRLLIEMKPDRLEDLIAANALFRPGPMDLIPDYNRRKHGQAPVPKVHAIVDKYTSETYGVMVYQEQVMQIVHGLGGIKLRDAYTLIKNISKKKHDKIEKERPKFVEGSQKQGLTKDAAEELFELILKFAGYGFNKSHSTGYAIVAYQTAYLKTYYPNQYMAAFLTFESAAQQVADWVPYLEDCKNNRFIEPKTGKVLKVGVEVRPPDVNMSDADFSVVFEEGEAHTALSGHVRFGLGAIKGCGDKAIAAILSERNGDGKERKRKAFPSLFDFCERVSVGGSGGSSAAAVNKTTIEALIKSGAMDCLHGRANRAAMIGSVESAVAAGASAARDRAAGQGGLFGLGGEESAAVATAEPSAGALLRVIPWSEAETLANERAVLGFYVSSHPLDQYKTLIRTLGNTNTRELRDRKYGQDYRITLGGMITGVRNLVVKSGRSAGQKMAAFVVEDKEGTVQAVAFSDTYAKYSAMITADRIVFIVAKVDLSRGDVQLMIEKVIDVTAAASALAEKMRVVVDERVLNGTAMEKLEKAAGLIQVASKSVPRGGDVAIVPAEIVVRTGAADVILASEKLRLVPTPELVVQLTATLGDGGVEFDGERPGIVKREPKPWEKKKFSGGGDDE